MFSDIAANPIVEHVTSTLFGSGAFNSFYNGNTNTPNSETQPLHMDTGHLWHNLNPSHPTHMVVVNISPIDTTEENGAVELWPGTHLIGDVGRAFLQKTRRSGAPKYRPSAEPRRKARFSSATCGSGTGVYRTAPTRYGI